MAEHDNTGTITAKYTHGYTQVDGIGSMISATKEVGGATYYQYPIYDHRGTVVKLVDMQIIILLAIMLIMPGVFL